MADFDDNENMLNQSENKFNSVGIMRDSDNTGRNTVSISNFAESSQKKRKGLNQTLNVQNKIAQNLANFMGGLIILIHLLMKSKRISIEY